MSEYGAVRALAIPLKILRHDSRNGHGDSDEAVMIDADPDDIEPGQTALGCPPRPSLTATALGKPVYRPYPWFYGAHISEEFLLFVQVGRDVVAHEGEEGGNGESLIAVAENLEVDGMPVVPYT